MHQPIANQPAIPAGAGKPKVYSYARWSTAEQANGDSNRRQEEAAMKWAERNGLELDVSLRITDEGVSAYRGGNALEGGLGRFLEACRRGLIESGSFLLVESLDRISRMAPRKAQRLMDDIVDSGVTIVTLSDDQRYNTERLDNDPQAMLIALMVAWRAHEESKTKGRRVAEAWSQKRLRVRENPNERLTKRGPSWLVPTTDSWKLDPTKAAAVQRIYALTLAGTGEHKIAAILNAEQVPVLSNGQHWHRSTVAKVLRNPAVIGTLVPGHIRYVDGQRHHVKEEPIANAFPAVISEADWLAVRALKDGKLRGARGRNAARPVHIYAGLAKCPACGAAMIRVNKGSAAKGGLPKLVCRAAKAGAGCAYVSVRVREVEEAFLANWGALFASIPADDASGELDAQYRELEGAIYGTEDHLEHQAEAFRKHRSPTLAREIGRLDACLQGMRHRLGELDERRRMADRGLIRARMDDLHDQLDRVGPLGPLALDRASINARLNVLFDAVIVDHQAGLLRFSWRQGGETSIRYAWID
ncbi:recombinase family protein [Sphingomonas sp. ASV193]|uniref:recombinase family protein n=1 Tax=Sphingomonas sp. ASV193 TaxID=3144405 RepID=UPI0032E8D36F